MRYSLSTGQTVVRATTARFGYYEHVTEKEFMFSQQLFNPH